MPDSAADEPQLAKRQRNLVFFSVAILIIGFSPTEAAPIIHIFGISIEGLNGAYLWKWATAASLYLYLAWVITSHDEDQWLHLRGGKLSLLWQLRDLYWLRWITWQGYKPHSYSSDLFENDDNRPVTLTSKICLRIVKDGQILHNIFADKNGYSRKESLFKKTFVDNNLSIPWPFLAGYKVDLHIIEDNGEYLYSIKEHKNSQPYQYRTLTKELLFSFLPPLTLGALAIYVCLGKVGLM